jgi:hypothetical protein
VTGRGAPSAAISVTPGLPATVPGAPTIGVAIAGNALAVVTFTPPVSDGNSPIFGYTVTCGASGQPLGIGTGSSSPVTVLNLINDVFYLCSVVASNAIGASAPSETALTLPFANAPLELTNVVSRKTHGAAGDFDLAINAALITGLVTVESRAIGAGHTILFRYNAPITAPGTLSVVDGNGVPVGASAGPSANDVVVTIPSLADNTRVTILLTGTNGTTNRSASMGFLIGDVNNTRSVNSSDISGVKARSGQTTTAANFKFDVNASGAVNSSDISAVKARSGLVLP